MEVPPLIELNDLKMEIETELQHPFTPRELSIKLNRLNALEEMIKYLQIPQNVRRERERDIRNLRYDIGRLITLKQIKNAENIDDIIKKTISPDVLAENVPAIVIEAIDTGVIPAVEHVPNTPLIDACKRIIDGEFNSINGFVPPPDQDDPDDPYPIYLQTFGGNRIFTLQSYSTQDCPQGHVCPPHQMFLPDNVQPQPQPYDIGAYNSNVPNPQFDQYKKYYEPAHFDTMCLLVAILYRIKIQQHFVDSEINLLISSYTHDPDPDDLYDEAENDIFTIFTVYGIVKRITAFIKTGNIDPSMRYLRALQQWIAENDDRGQNAETSQLLLKRIGIMTELLWYVLFRWRVVIPPCPENAPEIGPCNVKLYAGIGTRPSDANYEIFVAGLFNNMAEHTSPNCFHNLGNPPYPAPGLNQDGTVRDIPLITSRDFVSTAYSFDAAAKFCKILDCGQQGQPKIFCMLEFILKPGSKLPFIGSSANEAEVLLKPGNVYRFIKRYKVLYTRLSRGEGEPMIIYIYQFLLIDIDPQNTALNRDEPPKMYVNLIPDTPGFNTYIPLFISQTFNLLEHPDWSETVNLFIDEFSRLANILKRTTSTQEVVSDFNVDNDDDVDNVGKRSKSGGSKIRKTKVKRRRRTNKRMRTIRSNRRRSKRRRTNKKETKRRRI